MANEVIIEDDKLVEILKKALLENGARDFNSDELEKNTFTEEELEKITSLDININEIKSLEVLKKCTNLKELQIDSMSFNEILKDSIEKNENDFSEKNEILDLSVIENLSNLESLTIKNSKFLINIDLQNLKKLKALNLENNEELKEIKGLEDLKELEKLSLIQNSINNFPELQSLIEKSDIKKLEIDMDVYPQIVEKNPEIASFLEEKKLEGNLSVQFKEKIGSDNSKEVPLNELKTLEERTQIILANIIEDNYTEIEKISAVYSYLTQNVMYSMEMEKTQDQTSTGDLETNKVERPKLDIDKLQTYSALTKEDANIKGYANLMHYMLRTLKIQSKVVNSKTKTGIGNEEAFVSTPVIRVKTANDWYYFDPELDKEKKDINNFFKTKDEIEINHKLSEEEYDIKSPRNKAYTNFELTQNLNKVSKDIERKEENTIDSKQESSTKNDKNSSDISSLENEEEKNEEKDKEKKDKKYGDIEVNEPNKTSKEQKDIDEEKKAKDKLKEAFEKGNITEKDLKEVLKYLEETLKQRGLEGVEQDIKEIEEKQEENEKNDKEMER